MKTNLPTWGVWNPYFILFPEQVAQDNFEPQEICINAGTISMVDQNPIMMQKHSAFSKEAQVVLIECPDGYSRILTTSPLMPVFFGKKKAVSLNLPTSKGKRPRISKPIEIKSEQDAD